jgi:hypothetical protein
MKAYKLFRKRQDGSLGPLFINRPQRVPIGKWLPAEDHPTKGYAHRPGWHACTTPIAPHLSEEGRVWCEVEVQNIETFIRPEHQGGTWLLAQRMKVIRELTQIQEAA